MSTSPTKHIKRSTDCPVLFNEVLFVLTYVHATTASVSEKLQWPNYQCQFNLRPRLVKVAFKYTVRGKASFPSKFDKSNSPRSVHYIRPYNCHWRHLQRLSPELLPHCKGVYGPKPFTCDRLQRPRHRVHCKCV